jgi:hypothetical protein
MRVGPCKILAANSREHTSLGEQPLRQVREALPSGIMPVGTGCLAARVGRGERR